MNDFSAINDIIAQSIKDSSYTTVIISSCVFLVYTLIVRLVEYYKSRNHSKPLLEMATALKENTANIVKLNGVLDKTFRDAERKEITKARTAIEISFAAFKGNIYSKCCEIIIRNNVHKNEAITKDNIHRIVSNEYYRTYSNLSSYEIEGAGVETRLKDSWIKDVSDDIINIVYNNGDSGQRISQLNTRLELFIKDYITYMENKLFNH